MSRILVSIGRQRGAKRLGCAAALIIATACAKPPVPPAAGAFDPSPWLEDLAQLEHHLGIAYANLEWNHAHRGLDLDQLARGTQLRIREAGSAREWFAAVLQDNRAATLVGEQTAGAGCGYTEGGIPLTLSHTGIAIAAPDCARYRRDGSNEIDGVRPDVALDWTLADRTGRWASYAEKALNEAERLFRAAE